MAVGKGNRIVVEIEPDLKSKIYTALRARGMTFKDWLTEKATTDLLTSSDTNQIEKSKTE